MYGEHFESGAVVKFAVGFQEWVAAESREKCLFGKGLVCHGRLMVGGAVCSW
jgi:hypothetical protein